MAEENHQPETSSGVQVVVPLEEFAEDLDVRLGRANGNIYHRRQGIEGVHDGQVMVRLKKKRFIIIDYSIIPNEADIQAAAASPHIQCPSGAGKQKCSTPECPKVGVPVLLYDSDPNEPSSLYMRSGLCFTCQRNLNEKRRTQRKRTSDDGTNNVIHAVGQKKVKLNGSVMELNSDAIVLNGPPDDGTKTVHDGYGFHEIGPDLIECARQAAHDAERLINAVSSNTTTVPVHEHEQVNDSATGEGEVSTEEAANAAVDAVPTSSVDINALYEKAFNSLSKSIYLVSQWKHSWDAAIAAAVAQETVGDPSLADAVASAAAVAAAATTEGQEGNNMASLLLAADQRKGGGDGKGEADGEDVQTFEV